jgi:hypothetical protein
MKIKIFYFISIILVLQTHPGFCQTDVRDSVYTPKGSRVYAWRTGEEESWLRDTLDNAARRNYSENTYITTYGNNSSTRKFNCHGYAWYMAENVPVLDDPRWIGKDSISEEDIYMTDGSYVQVASEMYPGKVSWGAIGSDHSAVTTSQTGVYISKWGFGPFVEHAFDNSPYGTQGLKYYASTNISGSTSTLCKSASRNFSVVSIPNATYSWSVGSGLSMNQNGNTVNVTATSNVSFDTAWVRVTITSPLGNNEYDIKTSKKIYFPILCPPSAPIVTPGGDPPIEMGIYSYKDIVVTNYPGSASWSSSGAVQTIWNEGQTGRFYSTEEGSAYFYVTTYNSCGGSSMYQGSIEVSDDMMEKIIPGKSEIEWTISPNPSKTYFDLEIRNSNTEVILSEYFVEIIDSYSKIRNSFKLSGPNNRIYLNNITTGSYFVRIKINGQIYQKTLIVI